MSRIVWEFEHSVESGVPRQFAWRYWTDAANWEDPPARFEFDGPFAVGTRIRAILPDQTLWSVIREVKDGQAARIETEVHGAVLAFHWRFEEVAAQRTRMRQRLELYGPEAEALLGQARFMEQSVPQGMARMAGNMERAWEKEDRKRDFSLRSE